MAKQVPTQPLMVPVQMTTQDGAFICNVRASDLRTIENGKSGAFVIAHCVIRLDAKYKGLYELHETKKVEVSSIDFCRPIRSNLLKFPEKGRLALCEEEEGHE